jgi:LemA protein
MFGYSTKPNFTVQNAAEIQEAPKVDFGQPAAAPAPAPAPAPPAGG